MFCCWNLKSITKHILHACLCKGRSSVWISRHSLFSNNDLRTCPDWTRSYLFCSLSMCVWGTSFLEGVCVCWNVCSQWAALQAVNLTVSAVPLDNCSDSIDLFYLLHNPQTHRKDCFASCKAIIEEVWPDDRFLLCVITNRVIKTNSKDTWCLLFRARDVCISIHFANCLACVGSKGACSLSQRGKHSE